MPLTNEQKAFLIFKEFTGLSDEYLFENDEELQRPWSQNSNESFDSAGNEAEEVNPNASMTALTSIDQNDVNHAAIKSAGEQLKKMADNKTVSDMVKRLKPEVDDLFMRNNSILYDAFRRFMLQLLERDMRQNKTFCYAAILSLSNSKDLRNKHGTHFIWWCSRLLREKQFADVAASFYDETSGTSV